MQHSPKQLKYIGTIWELWKKKNNKKRNITWVQSNPSLRDTKLWVWVWYSYIYPQSVAKLLRPLQMVLDQQLKQWCQKCIFKSIWEPEASGDLDHTTQALWCHSYVLGCFCNVCFSCLGETTTLFCCEVLEMFCGLRNFTWLSISDRQRL